MPPSETEGLANFDVVGKALTNAPAPSSDYIPRSKMQSELNAALDDDRRIIVTLLGKGGIGKTYLALKAIQDIAPTGRFQIIVWFSARDIDLLEHGPKTVRPHVLSQDDISRYYAELVGKDTRRMKRSDFLAFFQAQLAKNEIGPCLYVFDNFETAQNPSDLFRWIDTHIRLPNKVLITTRQRDFRGDFPIDVRGMEIDEAATLIKRTSLRLGIDALLTDAYVERLISESEGHPYAIKIMLGEVAKERRLIDIARLVASREEVLTALFERTYAALSPICQRVYLTLAAWNSSVPRVALEAIILKSCSERVDVAEAVDTLAQYSVAEILVAESDGQEYVSLPLLATVFGKKKLNVSPSRPAINADVELLQLFGPSRQSGLHAGLDGRVIRFIKNIAGRVEKGESVDDFLPILEMICRSYNLGWLLVASWLSEDSLSSDLKYARDCARRYLEGEPFGSKADEAWRLVANCSYRLKDTLGEVHAFIERAQLSSVPFYDLSNTANRFNGALRQHELSCNPEEKRNLAARLLEAMDRRRSEANADDFSRMAWLAIHKGDESLAREFVTLGLQCDSDNYHCRKLGEKWLAV